MGAPDVARGGLVAEIRTVSGVRRVSEDARVGAGEMRIYSAMVMFFTWVKLSSAPSTEYSRPRPDCLIPP
jgi:hypothetical protein